MGCRVPKIVFRNLLCSILVYLQDMTVSKTWLKMWAGIALLLGTVSSCGNSGEGADGNPLTSLLGCVPSDACGIICCERLSAGMENLFDSDSPFRDISFGELSSARAVVSYHYTGEISVVTAIDAGRSQGAEKRTAQVVSSAALYGIDSRLIVPEGKSRAVLVLSSSPSLIDSAERIMRSEASVLDVPGLADAVAKAPAKGDVILLRNDSVGYLFPKDFLTKYIPRSKTVSFIKTFSEWTILSLTSVQAAGRGEYMSYEVSPVCGDDPSWGAVALDAGGFGESKVHGLLPQGTTFVIDQCFEDVSLYMEQRRKYLDSQGKLNSFENSCKSMRRKSGIDPVKWLADTDIKEIARVRWKNEEVLLLRPAKDMVSHDISANKYRGFIPLLFGQAYSIKDDSSAVCIGNWLVMGSRSAVKHFISSELRLKTHGWPVRGVRAVVLADDLQLSWDKGGIRFDVYRTF